MDQKSWLWKKRSTEKTLVADKGSSSFSKHEEEVTEVQELLTEKRDLERDHRILNEKLSSALSECNAKDNIAKKQVKIAEEAIAGWEKAEIEAISLRQELDKVLQQKATSDERLGQLDAALKECMQQLRFVRKDQDQRVHSAVVKTSDEFEKITISLDEKLAEAGKRLAKLDAENTQLRKALSGKDRGIEDLSQYRTQLEADFNALMLRVESTEKENGSLKYELRVLEKELDIRNEEREFNRRMADAAQKHHQESVKRITRLETECQRLRLLVQKRLPGPAALAKMKSEVAVLRKDHAETRWKSNPSSFSSMEFCIGLAPDAPSKRISLLTEQLFTMEEENRALKDALNKKSSDLQFSTTTCVGTPSRLSQVAETGKYLSVQQERTLAAPSDMGSDDKASCAESWASALISELEHFKNEKQLGTPSDRNMRISDMSLMDDFAEMEKLAVVSVDYPAGSSHHSSEEGNAIVGAVHPDDIKISPNRSLKLDESYTRSGNNISNTEQCSQKLQSDVSVSIHKILELVEGINVQSQANDASEKDDKLLSYKNSENPTGYMVRVFQWKTAELSAILQQFVRTCNDLLKGTAKLEQFCLQVASNLEWIMNHCFSLQDVSSMKNAIRNHLDWDDESRSESEVDSGSVNTSVECNRLDVHQEDMPCFPVEGVLESGIIKGECFRIKFRESKDIVENLHSEMENVKQFEGNIGNQIEKQKMMNEDLETQRTDTDHEEDKASQSISHLENELENKNNSCKRLEETCHDLRMQLKSMTSKEVPDNGNQWEKQLQNDWEITAASEKLAECQETILNLGKQLKALASPSDAALFDKVIPTTAAPADSVSITSSSTPRKNLSRRSSLLDKMLAEDNRHQLGASLETNKGIQDENGNAAVCTNALTDFPEKFNDSNEENKRAVASMDIVPCKKNGGRSFLKKLFSRQKKGKRD